MNKRNMTALNEGVNGTKSFSFDFSHDDGESIIDITCGLRESRILNNVYFFQYVFNGGVPSEVRSAFIHDLKFDQEKLGTDNVSRFIRNAVYNLQVSVNLHSVDCLIYPTSSSDVVKRIIHELFSYVSDDAKFICVEAAKKTTDRIKFNVDKFNAYCDEHHIGENERKVMVEKMERMIGMVRSKEYFSIAKDIRGSKYRDFLRPIYEFTDPASISLMKDVKDSRVLIVDDIATSGATMRQLVKAFRILNDDSSNDIVAFTLIGCDMEDPV